MRRKPIVPPVTSPRPPIRRGCGPASDSSFGLRIGAWRAEIQALDVAVYDAIASSPTPTFDRGLRALSRAADKSKLWIAVAGLLAGTRGRCGRRAAVNGLASIALASTLVNLGVKPLAARRRPDPAARKVPVARLVPMPGSTSFPSAHAASAFAFASGVSRTLPLTGAALHWLATLVAYSRVHTGVHYPTDVIVGALLGEALGPLATGALDRGRARH
jgi:membrane-associated phospholipid phosphatase